jgi:hypothetical protein
MGKNSHWDKPDKIDIEAKASANAYGWTGKITYAEAGACPVPLRETSEQAVHLWVNKMMTIGHDKGLHYAPSCLRLFVGSMGFTFYSEEYKTIVKHIATAIPGGFDVEYEEEPRDPRTRQTEGESDFMTALARATKPTKPEAPKPAPPEEKEDDWLAPVERQTVKGIGGGEEDDEIKL